MTLSHLRALLLARTFKLPLRVDGLHEDAHGAGLHGIDSIVDADREYVVQADSGVYPPTTRMTGELITAEIHVGAISMSHLALVFGMIGRLRAIEAALDYDLRPAKAERDNVVVPREVWEAMMRAWRLAKGWDARSTAQSRA